MEHSNNGVEPPENQKKEKKQGRGRPGKDDILKYRYMVRFNDAGNKHFLLMFEQSGFKSKSRFMADCVLNRKLTTITINKSAIDFVIVLSQFFAQFRSIKTNYNQLFAILVRELGEDKARFMMRIVEKQTLDFIRTMKEIEELTTKLREKWLPK